jgi:folate-dependent phosphoribosylglycinamide formyltransferase PurN
MMGYMSIARGELVEEYGWLPSHTSPLQARLSNTHPGPLPETADTYGIHASERVLELGLKQSKHTFHLVSAGVDEGPIYAEHPVDVPENCTAQELFERVQVAEKAALPYAINDFLKQQRAFYE